MMYACRYNLWFAFFEPTVMEVIYKVKIYENLPFFIVSIQEWFAIKLKSGILRRPHKFFTIFYIP